MSFFCSQKFLTFRNDFNKNDFFKNTKNTLYEIFQVARDGDLWTHVIDYQSVFKLKTIDLCENSVKYLEGLFCAEHSKRNIERMVEKSKAQYQSQQHFITDSPWSASQLMMEVAKKVNKDLGDIKLQALNIDENSNKKSGKHSVGVSRQYNGNEGKIENSQTGVFASLGSEDKVSLVNARLYLPKEWTDDEKRCVKAGVPKKDIKYATKVELAMDLIDELDNHGIEYGWIGADSLYGQGYEFANALDRKGKKFVLDVKKNQHIYLTEPEVLVEKRETKKGKQIVKLTIEQESVKVENYYKTLIKNDFTQVEWRKGTKGWLKALFHVQTVWVWDSKSEKAQKRTLIIRKDRNKTKYSLSNFTAEESTIEEFAYMQGQRYWIERSFQENIGELGMTDYQVRKYNSWYHHMALVMMAMHYILKKKFEKKEDIPLLSARDIRLQTIAILLSQGVTMEDEIAQMITRHKQREKDIERHYKDEPNDNLHDDFPDNS
ncbi:MAG: IS701 family transposase [Saprospiraceae bacterium]